MILNIPVAINNTLVITKNMDHFKIYNIISKFFIFNKININIKFFNNIIKGIKNQVFINILITIKITKIIFNMEIFLNINKTKYIKMKNKL